ncbi:MAG: HupE/UreJ family protein [Comamonadaceae bacterium]|nr:MAG: HupE/UreJ family protein [Comamonadaceae bacterium]
MMNAADTLMTWCGRWLLVLAVLAAAPAFAHKASDGYMQVNDAAADDPAGSKLQLSLAIRDIDAVIDTLDADGNRQITRGEIRLAMPAIAEWVGQGALFRCGVQPLAVAWAFEALEQRIDGAYVRLAATVRCAGSPLAVDYSLMKNVDPTHRLIVSGSPGGQPLVAVLSPQGRGQGVLRQAVAASGPATLAQFFAEGVHHIVTGYDHLAFLLVLMLPIVLYRRTPLLPGEPVQNARTRRGVLALFMTVTGFTVGHSLTLGLATLGVVSASPRWVEPAIAVTIAVSALLNLFPVRHVRGDVLAIVFGMIHGLAFSSVMTEAGISGALLVWGLAGFNLGVEAGQLAGVAVWCCIHLALVRWRHYERVVVRGGSWALLLLALYWAAERVGA